MVGTAALILVSSVILRLPSSGTFRSTLTNTFFPFRSAPFRSSTLLFFVILSSLKHGSDSNKIDK
ncbi:hypothetical protein MA16_Dca005080 [Dendrobium catenatum]|uniref:Secreted protein n=1 Tax=Dendrobium catenatum TaxID=906689 RepID=A0A2I0WGW8_9ASPA|nr:hypothetical protein MA16_Dca005080 [Dendrobium catenatum]